MAELGRAKLLSSRKPRSKAGEQRQRRVKGPDMDPKVMVPGPHGNIQKCVLCFTDPLGGSQVNQINTIRLNVHCFYTEHKQTCSLYRKSYYLLPGTLTANICPSDVLNKEQPGPHILDMLRRTLKRCLVPGNTVSPMARMETLARGTQKRG